LVDAMNDGASGDETIVQAINGVLAQREPPASACPSEVARRLATNQAADQWRPLLPAVRRVAATLALQGELEITQRGAVVDPQRVLDGSVRGPIRLRRR
jgi:hypothetical protein